MSNTGMIARGLVELIPRFPPTTQKVTFCVKTATLELHSEDSTMNYFPARSAHSEVLSEPHLHSNTYNMYAMFLWREMKLWMVLCSNEYFKGQPKNPSRLPPSYCFII